MPTDGAADAARAKEANQNYEKLMEQLQEEELNAMKKAAAAGHPEAKLFMERESVAEEAARHEQAKAIYSKEGKDFMEMHLNALRCTAKKNYDTAANAGKKAKNSYVKAVLNGAHPDLALYRALPDKSILSDYQQRSARHHEAQALITKKYKNVAPDFFDKDTDLNNTQSLISFIRGTGITFPEGSSVSYDRQTQTIKMTNKQAEHDNMKEVLKVYREETAKK